jgi:hypothetical protein
MFQSGLGLAEIARKSWAGNADRGNTLLSITN